MNALLKCTLLILTLGVANAATPSFSSFNTNQFSTNNLFISIKPGSLVTNLNINSTTFTFNGTTITNIVQTGGGGDSLWTNDVGTLRPLAGSFVNVTNLTSNVSLISQGSFRLPVTGSVSLSLGTNCVNPAEMATLGIIGATSSAIDSEMTLEIGSGSGSILVLLNNDPGNNSGFTVPDGIEMCDGSGGYLRLNGDWATEQYGDGLVLYNTGVIWTELTRFSATTNTVVDGVWQYVDGIIKPVSEDTERIRIDGTGGISVGSTAFEAAGATLISIRDVAAGDDDYNELYMQTVDGADANDIDFYVDSSDINVAFTAQGDVVTLFNPTVINGANAVANRLGSFRYLNQSGAKIIEFPNAGTNVNTINHNGGITIGRDAEGQWGNNQSLTAFYNTSLGEPNISEGTFGVTDGGALFKYIDIVVSDSLGGQFVMDNGALEVHLNPGVTSGSAVAHKLGTSQVLTNGDTFVSIDNTNVPIFRFQPGPSGNPAGQITFGPGSTNVVYRDEGNLQYTNGNTSVYLKVMSGAAANANSGFGTSSAGHAQVLADTGRAVVLAVNNASDGVIVTTGLMSPSSSNGTLDLGASNNQWNNLHLDNNIAWNGSAANLIDTWGTATPEGAETAGPGSLFRLTNAVGKVYLKVTGTGNTGWAELATTASAQIIYDQLVHPHRADQVGAVLSTADPSSVNYGHALFSGTAATNANFIEYRWQVPKNINTSVDLQASWSVMLNAADTDASTYTIGMASVAASSSYAAPTLGNYVTLTVAADASGAQNDYETVQDVTLTGWAAALTAGNIFVIRVARDGAGDTSNVAHYDAGLTIKYSTQ